MYMNNKNMTVMNPWPQLRLFSIIPAIIITGILHYYVYRKYSHGFLLWIQSIVTLIILEFFILPFLIFLGFELILG